MSSPPSVQKARARRTAIKQAIRQDEYLRMMASGQADPERFRKMSISDLRWELGSKEARFTHPLQRQAAQAALDDKVDQRNFRLKVWGIGIAAIVGIEQAATHLLS